MVRRRLTKAEMDAPELRGLIYEIDEAAARMRSAEEEAALQRAHLHDAMQRAYQAGLGYRRLGEASGYSWQRAEQIVRGLVAAGVDVTTAVERRIGERR